LKIAKAAQILGYFFPNGPVMYVCIYFDKTWVGQHFGRLFHKLIWSPCTQQTNVEKTNTYQDLKQCSLISFQISISAFQDFTDNFK
jgi:hypothetical protein